MGNWGVVIAALVCIAWLLLLSWADKAGRK
jgi:hypothetical protein